MALIGAKVVTVEGENLRQILTGEFRLDPQNPSRIIVTHGKDEAIIDDAVKYGVELTPVDAMILPKYSKRYGVDVPAEEGKIYRLEDGIKFLIAFLVHHGRGSYTNASPIEG